MVAVEEALDEFFKLRGQYTSDLQRRRSRIVQSSALSYSEKKQKLMGLKGKCPNCRKASGLKFTQNGSFLTMSCSDINCPLEIRIDRGRYVPLSKLALDNIEDRNAVMQNIMEVKLDMLFGFLNESETIQKFNVLKKQFKLVTKKLGLLINDYKKSTTDEAILVELKAAEDSIIAATVACEAIANGEAPDKARKLVRLLIDEILPKAEEIMKMKYGVNAIIKVDEKKHDVLVQKRTSYEDNLVLVRKASVIRYVR